MRIVQGTQNREVVVNLVRKPVLVQMQGSRHNTQQLCGEALHLAIVRSPLLLQLYVKKTK